MTNIQEQDKRKGGRPPTGRVRKLSKSVTVKFSKPSYEALRLRARKANRKLAEYIRWPISVGQKKKVMRLPCRLHAVP